MRLKRLTVLFGILFIYILLFATLVFAEIILGNNSGDLELFYGPGETLRGWINISIINESSNSTLFFYNDQKITLIELLRKNSVSNWSCSPLDCADYYSPINGDEIKTFNIARGDSKVIGLQLRGTLSNSVNEMHFNISSDAMPACSQQLKIDIAEDNNIDWIPLRGVTDYSCSSSSGNYNSSEQLTLWSLSPTIQYCQKIKVPAIPSMQVGADIIKNTGTGSIVTMNVYYENSQDLIGSCEIPAISSSGEYYCNINGTGFLDDTDIFVCIKGPVNYQIKSENAGNVSGFFDLENHVGFSDDYSIFVKGGKYGRIGSFSLDSYSFKNYIEDVSEEELIEYLRNYLTSKYSDNCQNKCIIPIKFIAGDNQQIRLSNLVLGYGTISGNTIENKFYDLNKRNARLNSGFLKLNLQAANFTVPTQLNNNTISIRTENGDVIIRKEIQIKSLPKISDLIPRSVPALVSTNFFIIIENAINQTTYKWNFGDNSSEETTNKSSLTHTYLKRGNYEINIKAINANGESSKTFAIEVISPKNLINSTISSYKTDISNFEKNISVYPIFLRAEIEKYTDLANVKEEIDAQEKAFSDDSIDDDKAIQIMSRLVELKIPSKISISKSIKPSVFYMNRDQLDLERLTTLGAGKQEGTFDDNYNKINSWIREKINVTIESKSYIIYFRDKTNKELFSDIKFTLAPKEKIKEMYFIINENTDKVKFSEELNPKIKDDYLSISLLDLTNSKTIEFLYPTQTDLLNFPVVISPPFSDLQTEAIITSDCNLNKICEKELGENFSNCSDCKKNWIWIAAVGLLILAAIFFIVYIIMQEWYKTYYESNLFKDRNNLFNLINFMNNSEIQGISKSEVFKKLRSMSWTGEQLTYAYNKLHGKRTGMWEIPLFKGRENKEVRRELIKRQRSAEGYSSNGGNTRPGIPSGSRRF